MMSALVVYEDQRSRRRAELVCDDLVNRSWPQIEFRFNWWRTDFLEDPGMAAMVAPDAAQADLIIFSGGPDKELSRNVVAWFEAWAERRNGLDGALMDLTETGGPLNAAAHHKKTFLREIARRTMMGYLSRPAAEGPVPAQRPGNEAPLTSPNLTVVIDNLAHTEHLAAVRAASAAA